MVEDRAPDGGWVPGGPSLYCARAADALGARVTLVTRLNTAYDRAALAGLDVRSAPAATVPRYANRYDAHGERTQFLLAPGESLDVPLQLASPADALIVAPAYHECAAPPPIAHALLAVSLQGVLRTTDTEGRVRPVPDPAALTLAFSEPGSFAFFSEEDTDDPGSLATNLAARDVTVLLTRGYRGATVYAAGRITHFDALPARPVDPTGAGDCFASAFVVRYVETQSLAAALPFALAAGALAVEGSGLAGVPTRAAIESRLARVAA